MRDEPQERASAAGLVLAIDAGGSGTRAVLVDHTARCLGYGVASSGNPVAVGAAGALAAYDEAAREALDRSGHSPVEVTDVVLAAAGGSELPVDDDVVLGALSGARLHRIGDVLAMYHSATTAPEGLVVAAGTGAVAAHYRRLEPVRVHDGLGWLIGDAGGGFWIGRRIVRAVARAIDGTDQPTALTAPVLAALRVADVRDVVEGRPAALLDLISRLHAEPPVDLARLAPLAFAAAADGDPVAVRIAADAEGSIAGLVRTVRRGHEHLPVVLGGSVLTQGLVGAGGPAAGGPLAESLAGTEMRSARNGVAGAAIVGLLLQGYTVADEELGRLTAEIRVEQAAE